MTAPPLIVSNHSDEALNAEIAFWATSANFAVKNAARAELPALCADANARAVIFELKNHDEEALDFLAKLSAGTKAKVIAVTALDQKTVSSIRRLFEAKALNIFVLERADFNTRLLADLTRPAGNGAGLDRDTLSRAIADGHVIAHYQPKVPFQPGIERYGVEALCRIQHPERGMLYPDSFIPLAEAHGLLHDLTDAVTVHAFRSLAQWDLQGLQLRLALNIAPSLLNDMTWYEKFQARCQEFQIDPGRITVEVTESSSHGGKALALEILSRLRLKGFLLSIDDFGTGFSSLETLYKLPFGELKIDKGFVFDIQKSTEARALIESTVALAKKLGLKVCAEGVESEAVFEALRELKCDDAQGYYVSKPLPAERVVPFLEEWRSKCRAQKQNPASKFANLHALLGALLTTDDEEDDHTVVLSSPAASAPGKETGTTAAAALPALVMSGNMLKALEQVQRAIAACTQAEVAGLRPKLEDLRTEIECGLAGGATAELISPDGTIKILGGNSFIIGRQASNAKADIAIPCRWLSRGEKNLRLFWRDERWLLEDLGSTNGHFLGAQRLLPGQPVALNPGKTRLDVGRMPDGSAPAWLSFELDAGGAVAISFGIAGNPSESDQAVWIVFQGEVALGRSPDSASFLAAGTADGVADILLRDGNLWIAPRAGHSVALSGARFSQRVPLVLDTTLEVGGVSWQVGALTALTLEAAPVAASA